MISKKNSLALMLLYISLSMASAQYKIEPVAGYTPQIGSMVDMLEEIKNRIIEDVKDLNQAQTDYLFDDKANSIGALIMHLAATEIYYQAETLGVRPFTQEEAELLGITSGLGPASREKLQGKPIEYYLDLWNQVRTKTLEGLKTKDDAWFVSNIDEIDEGVNNYWVWFHVLEHSASHMGQIAMVKRRLPE